MLMSQVAVMRTYVKITHYGTSIISLTRPWAKMLEIL